MSKKYGKNSKRRYIRSLTVYSALAVLLTVLLFSVLFSAHRTEADDPTVKSYICVEVQRGDSLWDYAEQYAPRGLSENAYIRQVRELNHLSGSTIIAGQYLILPVYSVPEI